MILVTTNRNNKTKMSHPALTKSFKETKVKKVKVNFPIALRKLLQNRSHISLEMAKGAPNLRWQSQIGQEAPNSLKCQMKIK